MIGSTNAGGGGGAGGTLAVSGVAGHTVTATKDGKTYTRTLNSSGTADFKGLSTGEWSLTMAGGGKTTSSTVAITVDYSVTMKYFAATINVTYPEGSSCSMSDGSTTLTAPDTSGTWSAVVPNAGTWTVECHTSDGSKSKSATISITTDGQSSSVTLTYELVLFDMASGIDRTDLTGGWSKYKDGYIGYYDNNDGSGGRGCMCKTAVDFSGYSSLVFKTGTVIYDVSAQGGLSSSYNGSNYVSLSPKVAIASNKTYTLDVSSINTARYIGFNTGIHGSYYAVDQILVSHVHLE